MRRVGLMAAAVVSLALLAGAQTSSAAPVGPVSTVEAASAAQHTLVKKVWWRGGVGYGRWGRGWRGGYGRWGGGWGGGYGGGYGGWGAGYGYGYPYYGAGVFCMLRTASAAMLRPAAMLRRLWRVDTTVGRA